MMKGNNAVPDAVNNHHRYRADVADLSISFVFVSNCPAQGNLEGPGQPEIAELFPGNGAETGESAEG